MSGAGGLAKGGVEALFEGDDFHSSTYSPSQPSRYFMFIQLTITDADNKKVSLAVNFDHVRCFDQVDQKTRLFFSGKENPLEVEESYGTIVEAVENGGNLWVSR